MNWFLSSTEWGIDFLYLVKLYIVSTCWHILPSKNFNTYIYIKLSKAFKLGTFTSISHSRESYVLNGIGIRLLKENILFDHWVQCLCLYLFGVVQCWSHRNNLQPPSHAMHIPVNAPVNGRYIYYCKSSSRVTVCINDTFKYPVTIAKLVLEQLAGHVE